MHKPLHARCLHAGPDHARRRSDTRRTLAADQPWYGYDPSRPDRGSRAEATTIRAGGHSKGRNNIRHSLSCALPGRRTRQQWSGGRQMRAMTTARAEERHKTPKGNIQSVTMRSPMPRRRTTQSNEVAIGITGRCERCTHNVWLRRCPSTTPKERNSRTTNESTLGEQWD